MSRQSVSQTQASQQKSAFTPGNVLQRKCACGNHTMAGGECTACAKNKSGLQRKLAIGASNDPLEHEADRVAEQIVSSTSPSAPVSSQASGRLQREAAPKEKTNEEKYQEGLEKLGEAFLKTPLGKELLEKIKQDTLVKGATAFGKDFISGWPGKIVTGAAATGAVAALAATHKALPAQIPEIRLDALISGLTVQLTYKGPVDRPTEAMITFKFTEQAPKAATDKKPLSATDKFRAETARLAADDAKFRAGMTYTPGSPEDLQQKEEQEAIRKAVLKFPGGPDIEATTKKYPWLATREPKSGLQLTMPKPSFGIQPPSLFGDELKLKLPGEQKKKKDEPALQKKLSISASNDPLEQEADRVAEQVLAAPANPVVSGATPSIQRYTGQSNEGADTAPASVDRVLASSGRPLEPALRQDMEQRFGHDFSRVRVHSGDAAEQSARDVNANAYTVGHNIVFGAGQFAPGTHEGLRLLAHELTHTIQQQTDENSRLTVGDSTEHEREVDTGVDANRFHRPIPTVKSHYLRTVSRQKLEPDEPLQIERSFNLDPHLFLKKMDASAVKEGEKCEEFPGGSTECEVDEATGTPTGKVTHRIDETNLCTKPCVEQHEAIHVKQLKTFCPKLRDCYLAAEKGKRPVLECIKMAIFGNNERECAAYKVSVPCVENRLKNAKECQFKVNKEYGTRKLASEKCFRNKAC